MTRHRMSLIRLVVQGDWNAKWAGMLVETGKAFVDPSAIITQM